jgi:Rrf2 family transcriptional regulator, iron-sulfur cluster assembly transcription factor
LLKLSKKMLYAIEAVLDIAYHAGTAPVQSSEITRRQGIPKRYLEQALQHLVRSEILIGVRGPRGGYRLARERRRITVGEIVQIIDEVETSDGGKSVLQCDESDLCKKVVRPLMSKLRQDILSELNKTTIDDLCENAQKASIDSEGRETLDFII